MASPRPTHFFSLFHRSVTASSSWTCRSCHRSSPTQRLRGQAARSRRSSTASLGSAGRASSAWGHAKPKRRRRAVLLASSTAAAGAGVFAFTDDARHAVTAVDRSGRVFLTVAICVNEYRRVLKLYHPDDPDYGSQLQACHKRCALRALGTLEKNGSIFIKLGQHLSSLNYLLPSEWCDTFIPLQDRCPVSSYESVAQMVLKDTGHTLDHYFADFDPNPIGAASLAQVHLATMRDGGERVAVKVQHPGLDEWAKLDLKLTHWTFETLKYWFPEYDLTWLSDEMMVSLPQELDFVREGDNAEVAREYFSEPGRIREIGCEVVIPKVLVKYRRMLVMAFEAGHRPDDLEYLDGHGIDRDEVSAALARIFNEMIFGRGAPLHCDPHGGNIAVRFNGGRSAPPWTRRAKGNFDIVLYDHGLYRRIPLQLQRNYAKMWLAVLDADVEGMKKYAWEVAGVDEQHFQLFASAITGREFDVVRRGDVGGARRSRQEKQRIGRTLVGGVNGGMGGKGGLLKDVVGLLGGLPRVLLLVLKTNDLTRSLDEGLHTHQGPARTFLILARYASRTVYEEQLDLLHERGSLLWPGNLGRFLAAWWMRARIEVKLNVYESWLWWRKTLGMKAVQV